MSGFTKLVPEIVLSSIWNESAEIRCVWITLIAIKDKEGNVRGNTRSLARLANVPVETVHQALDIFQQPDPDSNNQEQEGRRIESIPGGWHVISHDTYRAKDYREHEAERKKEYRKNKHMSGACPGHVPDSSVSVSVSESESESESEGGCKGETKSSPGNKTGYSEDFLLFWKEYPNRKGKMDAWKEWQRTKDIRPPIDELIAEIKLQKKSKEWLKNDGEFIPKPSTWLARAGWEDEVKIERS